MTPRPFYRWKSFWLGLFVLAFFGWAWWESGGSRPMQTFAWVRGHQITWVRWQGMSSLWLGDAVLVRIPHVAVFFPFLALWSAWLFWHWKREQKKSAP